MAINTKVCIRHIKLAITIILMILLVGCDSLEVERKQVIDYRHNDSYTEVYTTIESKYNLSSEEWEHIPVTKTRYVPESYELLWEYTYKDNHTERHWKECTRFEYENAREELGE